MPCALPPDPAWPRYSARSLPPYRYVPGRSPHPRRDPSGHSYGRAEPTPPAWQAERWSENECYRFGIDLFNFAYWWESHEAFESLWRVAGRGTTAGRFQQSLVQLAAAHWKRYLGADRPARHLARRAADRLADFRGVYMGIDVPALVLDARRSFEQGGAEPVLIRLEETPPATILSDRSGQIGNDSGNRERTGK